jgi:hypothetical protein
MLRALGAILFLAGITAYAEEQGQNKNNEFVYAQKTGKFSLAGKELATGYSGKGDGKNNPDQEGVRNVGPIPAGNYRLSKPREYKGMKNCFDVTPEGHNALGRTEFLIHGDSKKNPGTASEGCIILEPGIRQQIAESGITRLRVVKE